MSAGQHRCYCSYYHSFLPPSTREAMRNRHVHTGVTFFLYKFMGPRLKRDIEENPTPPMVWKTQPDAAPANSPAVSDIVPRQLTIYPFSFPLCSLSQSCSGFRNATILSHAGCSLSCTTLICLLVIAKSWLQGHLLSKTFPDALWQSCPKPTAGHPAPCREMQTAPELAQPQSEHPEPSINLGEHKSWQHDHRLRAEGIRVFFGVHILIGIKAWSLRFWKLCPLS